MSSSSEYFGGKAVRTVQSGNVVTQSVSATGGAGTFTIPLTTVDLARAELWLDMTGCTILEGTNGLPRGYRAQLQATQILMTLYGGGPTVSISGFRWRVVERNGIRSIQRNVATLAAGANAISAPFVNPDRVNIRILGTNRATASGNPFPEPLAITARSTSGFSITPSSGVTGCSWEATEEL